MRQALEMNKDGEIVGLITVQNDGDIDLQEPQEGMTLVKIPPDQIVRVMGPKGEKESFHIEARKDDAR